MRGEGDRLQEEGDRIARHRGMFKAAIQWVMAERGLIACFPMLDTLRVFLYFSRSDIMWRHSSAGRAVES